jgi:hypothetical protein
MNEERRKAAKHLLAAKERKEKRRFPVYAYGFLLLGLILLSGSDPEPTPWGMLFFGIFVGILVSEIRWRKNGSAGWKKIKEYIDWERVERDAND